MNRASTVAPGLGVQVSDLDQVIVIQDFLGHPQGVGIQAHGGDTAALAVAPVVHLHRGLEDVAAGHRDAAAKPVTPQPPSSAALWMRPAGKGEVKSRRVSSRARPGWVFRFTLDFMEFLWKVSSKQ